MMDSHALVWPLELTARTARFLPDRSMRGRIPAHEEAWFCHKSETKVDVDSLLQATLPPRSS